MFLDNKRNLQERDTNRDSYAVWTSIGTTGAFLVGVVVFGETTSLGRYLGVLLIIAGVVTLQLA